MFPCCGFTPKGARRKTGIVACRRSGKSFLTEKDSAIPSSTGTAFPSSSTPTRFACFGRKTAAPSARSRCCSCRRTAPNAVSFFASRSATPGTRGNFAAKSRSRRCPLRNIFPREAPFPSPPKTRPTPRAKTSANPTRQKSSRRPFPSKVSRSRSAAAFSPRFRGIARRSAKSASASKETRREKFPPRRGRWTISRCARRTRRSR